MFFLYGWRGEVLDLGGAGLHQCPKCGAEKSYRLKLAYRYAHLYYLFGVVVRRRYYMLCDTCQNGWELEGKKVRPLLKSVPIPFMHQYGLLALGSAVVALVALSAAH